MAKEPRMQLSPTALAALFAVATATATGAASAQTGGAAQSVPELSLETLSGDPLAFPDELGGDATLLLLAFEREQQPDVDTWLTRAEALRVETGGAFDYYELPVIGSANMALRFVIDNGMRSGIPAGPARDRVLTVYDGADALLARLGAPSEATIHAVLVDDAGVVLWRAEGPASDASFRAMRAAVAEELR